jgi:hypothetical protein
MIDDINKCICFIGILGKRQGTVIGPDGKRMEMDDVMSINSVDESVPVQDLVISNSETKQRPFVEIKRG